MKPTAQSIGDGSYSMSRSLYIYIKTAHIGLIPGIPQFMQEITSEAAVGEEGYITMKGLLPQSDGDRKKWNTMAKNLILQNKTPSKE